jgi:hypothetical protein
LKICAPVAWPKAIDVVPIVFFVSNVGVGDASIAADNTALKAKVPSAFTEYSTFACGSRSLKKPANSTWVSQATPSIGYRPECLEQYDLDKIPSFNQ